MMESFLEALTPSVREQVDAALELDAGKARLERVVGPYIDDEGTWPTDPRTANYLARSFVTQSEFAMPRFSSSGLKGTTVAALAGGAVSLAAGEGLIVVGSALVERYWAEMIGYAYGINPKTLRDIKNVMDFVNSNTDWRRISKQMKNGFKSVRWAADFEEQYANKLTGVLIGDMADAAWRGTRSAANHLTDKLVGDVSTNDWIENYVKKLVKSQTDLSRRTARRIVDDALENGQSTNVIAGRLQQMWGLTPHHVDSVNRYRKNLSQQDRTASWVNRMTQRYVDRLLAHRIKTLTQSEVHTAFNLGREAQWMRSVQQGILPADTKKMWVTGRDEKVCPVCRPMDGKTAPLGEVFEEIGLYVPVAHPNCRCITIPVQLGVANMDEKQLVFPVRDMVNKRVIDISQYTKTDGTVVEAHQRRIDDIAERVTQFLSNFERDGELSQHETFALSSAAALALAVASRGKLRRAITPSVYKDIRKTKNGLTPNTGLRASLKETFEFSGSQYSTKINSIKVGDAPHHAMSLQAIQETLESSNRVARGFQRLFARRNNIRVKGNVVNKDNLVVGEFDIAIDPRRREAFQYGLYLNKSVQGKGFAGEFTAHLGKRYMETGIERIGALASGSVGGYAWAQRGFNWRYGPSIFVNSALKSAAEGRHANLGRQPAEVMREIERIRKRIRNGYLTRKFPTPKEVADIGRNHKFTHSTTGKETWAGREIMLDTQWHASLDLRQMTKLLRTEGIIKHFGGPSGELPHPKSQTPQEVHSGKLSGLSATAPSGGRAGGRDSGPFRRGEFDAGDAAAVGFVGLAGAMITRGRVRNMAELTMRMRRLNTVASRPLQGAKTGDIMTMSSRRMDLMTEGTGFRLGNTNHIKQIANSMMKHGYDQTQPVRMAVYNDGAQVLDGMHRAQAAKLAGIDNVPVEVIRVKSNMPSPSGFRSQYDAYRKAAARRSNLAEARPSSAQQYKTRSMRAWENYVNSIMERGGIDSTERFIRANAAYSVGKAAPLPGWRSFSVTSQRVAA